MSEGTDVPQHQEHSADDFRSDAGGRRAARSRAANRGDTRGDTSGGSGGSSGGIGRRSVVGAAAVLGGTLLGGGVVGHAVGASASRGGSGAAGSGGIGPAAVALGGAEKVAFHGRYQSGITTPHQAHGTFIGLDLPKGTRREKIISLLRVLGDDAERLMSGRAPLGALERDIPRTPANLTVTFGFGPGLFAAAGIPDQCPPVIADFPAFSLDKLDERWGQTDLVVQVCSDDPITLGYAQRRLIRDARTFSSPKWVQSGFVNARGHEPIGTTARNLMGMRDGSANERDPAQIADVVWNTGGEHPWLKDGSMLVLRRIAIDMEAWDDIEPVAKEISFGRTLTDGLPLTGGDEFTAVDRTAVDEKGFPVIAPNAHAARAQARSGEERMFRRPFNYIYEADPAAEPEQGLLFAAYQADLGTAFVPVQKRLDENDALNTWITHIGSAVYAIPPGIAQGEYPGQGLLEA